MLSKNNHYLIPSIIIVVGLLICSVIFSKTFIKIKGFNKTISVTGAAYQPIRSDYATWTAILSTSSANLKESYAVLDRHMKMVKGFLSEKGLKENDYEIGTVSLNKRNLRGRSSTKMMDTMTFYELRQKVEVEHTDVDFIGLLARNASVLIKDGVEIESCSPSYLFTGLDELKIEMIKRATENALLRAEQLAQSTGMKVGVPRSARVGVFQIRPLHSQKVSSYGISDVTSIEKEIACTVHINFMFE